MGRELFDPKEVFVGRDFGTTAWEITPELVDRYIAGTGDDNPWYRGESPIGGALAPALIVCNAVYSTLAWYLPNIYGNLHARQEWELFAPVKVGERLTTRAVVVDRYTKRDREYVVNEVLVANAGGQIVSRSRTHQSFLLPEHTRKDSFAVDKSREKDAARTFAVGERGGDPFDIAMQTITEAMCMAFSGPVRNYHNDREMAIALGFPEIVVQGMLSVCLVSAMMTSKFGMGFLYGGKMDLRLVNVLWGNETTGPKGLIVERRPEGKRTRAIAEVWCEKTGGIKTIVGSASALEL